MKKIFGLFFAFILLLSASLFSFGGCNDYSVMDFSCFGTEVYIAVKGKINEKAKNDIKTAFNALNDAISVSSDASVGQIAAFNLAKAGVRVNFSAAVELYDLSNRLYTLTDGLFNPAVLPATELWKLSATTFNPLIDFAPPSAESVADVLPITAWENVVTENKSAYKLKDGVKIDFGGIAKGYAADTAKKILENHGVKEGYISVGGSSLYVFATNENLSVKHPRKSGEYIFTVDKNAIKNSPLSTSGDYIRYYEYEGKRYPHIINGKTGYPADTGIISVTVIAHPKDGNVFSAAATDALSTAIMLMGKEQAEEFIKTHLAHSLVFIVYEKDGVKEIISNSAEINVIDRDYKLNLIAGA